MRNPCFQALARWYWCKCKHGLFSEVFSVYSLVLHRCDLSCCCRIRYGKVRNLDAEVCCWHWQGTPGRELEDGLNFPQRFCTCVCAPAFKLLQKLRSGSSAPWLLRTYAILLPLNCSKARWEIHLDSVWLVYGRTHPFCYLWFRQSACMTFNQMFIGDFWENLSLLL